MPAARLAAPVKSRALITVALLAVGTAVMYLWHLGVAPIYLAHDEVVFALHAESISRTGRDTNGALLPVFAYVTGNFWATPAVIYLSAFLLKFLPLTEWSVRLPSVLVGVADVVLIYYVGRQVVGSERGGVVAAVLLALTPSHMIHSRLGVDHLYPVPFVLASLLCLLVFLEKGRGALLFGSAVLLGLGTYTYLAAFVLMPLFFGLWCLALLATGERRPRACGTMLFGFALAVTPLVLWMAAHPAQYGQQVRMYNIYDAARLTPVQGLKDILSFFSLTVRLAVYHGFFNPVMLFLSGDASLLMSTREAGVFLLSMAAFLPLGILSVIRGRPSVVPLLMLAGFLAAPAAAVLVGEVRINRALLMLPFGVLLATLGVESLLRAGNRVAPVVAVALLAVMPWQFLTFYRDYMGDYRIRSSVWFERNIRGAFDAAVGRTASPGDGVIYLSKGIPWIDWHWKFYAIEHGQPDWTARARYFDPETLAAGAIPPHSVLVAYANDPRARAIVEGGGLRRLETVTEPNGEPSFAILEASEPREPREPREP